MGAPTKIHALLRYSDFRGDHAADCTLAIEPLPGETVEAFMQRAYWLRATVEVVELRFVDESRKEP